MRGHVSPTIVNAVMGVMAMLSLSSCDGILSGIYDNPLPDYKREYGFVMVNEQARTGRIYINATDYREWHYINLHGKQMNTVDVDDEAPEQWDFAVHRYDAKTNGGGVLQSDAGDFSSLPDVGKLPDEAFVADEWTTDRIRVDMSQMMDGVILYARDYFNPCLSCWLDVDTSSMPPTYTLSGKVYVLRLQDGTYAALRLSDFMNDAAVKGYMTIDYVYPLAL